MIKKLTALVLIAALAWSGWWAWSAHVLRGQIEDWFATRRADSWEASYSDLAIRGFPNRLDTTFTDLALADPGSGMTWQAPFFQIFQLTYKPGHIIAAWPEEHRLTVDGTTYAIADDGLRASLIFDASGQIIRSNVEARSLTVTPENAAPHTVTGLNAALQWVTADSRAYRLALTAQTLSHAEAAPLTDLTADLTAHLDAPLTFATLNGPHPQPTRLDIRVIKADAPPMTLRLSGDLAVDDAGRLDGGLDVTATDWRAFLDQAAADDTLPDSLSGALAGMLGMTAGLAGNGDTLDLPLTLKNGQMSIGFVPLGPAPRLVFP